MKTIWIVIILVLLELVSCKEYDITWEWGEKTKQICKRIVPRKRDQKPCEGIQDFVEEFFDEMGIDIVSAMDKDSLTEIRKRAMKNPWKKAGEDIIEESIIWVTSPENRKKKPEDIKRFMQPKFAKWMTKLFSGDATDLKLVDQQQFGMDELPEGGPPSSPDFAGSPPGKYPPGKYPPGKIPPARPPKLPKDL